MKLVILYGAPAVGKLTIAMELGKRTGFKVFHNHLSIDCVKPVFDFGTPPFVRLIETIRFATIADAAREGVDLIHTFVYALGEDDEHFARLIASAEDNGGEVHLVLLKCDSDVLKERIGSRSRANLGKLTDPDSIDGSLSRYDLRSTYPGRESLVIDTTALDPGDAAKKIVEYCGLSLGREQRSLR